MAKASANIRMYRLNELGDCFLLTFTAGTATSRMLIDCGSLKERTSNRVLQMDGVNPPEGDPAKAPAKASWEKIKVKPKVSGLAIELEIGS